MSDEVTSDSDDYAARLGRLEGTVQALEVMLRPGEGQVTPTIAHSVLVAWMQDDGIPLAHSEDYQAHE